MSVTTAPGTEEGRNAEGDEGLDGAQRLYTFPARAVALTAAEADGLLTIARQQALDPSIFDESPPYFWRAEISNNQLDSYYTQMGASSLKNYAEDATRGMPFMSSHRTGGYGRTAELPLGQSIAGRYIGSQGNGLARIEADFYTIRGLLFDATSTDMLINGMRSGVVRDVSITFQPGKYICSICGLDMLREWDCYHCPGVEYDVATDRKGGTKPALCTATVEDGHALETSAVFAGATPRASIVAVQAQRAIEAGRLKPDAVQLLESRYRIYLPGTERRFAGVSIPPKEATVPTDDTERGAAALIAIPSLPLAEIRAALTEGGQPPDAEPLAAIRNMGQEIARLRPLADDGTAYRADLVTEALAEGVRAHGATFATETYRGMLESAPLSTIKRMKDDWKALGDKLLPGGRQTQDERTDVARGTPADKPDAAYAA